ncbi:MAG: DUF1576 domain-containing protein [Clostridia bacterium]|nr:DUF1576 domain-containing protein [Clostridia bacterium]
MFGLMLSGGVSNLMHGLGVIVSSPTILITDFLEIGGLGPSFVNAALIGFFNLYLLRRYKLRINGLLIAAYMTVMGFAFFGKNIFNILPIYIGGYWYCHYQKIAMKNIILIIMFGTALAPIVSEMAFGHGLPLSLSLPLGIGLGVLIGFIIVPLSSHMLKFHDGYNLYNIGFTAGIIGTVFTSMLRSFKMEIQPENILYMRDFIHIGALLAVLFIYLIVMGLFINRHLMGDYHKILKYKGRTITDFTQLVGYGMTFFNMGIMGLGALAYVSAVGGVINGPVLAAIFTVVGFSAFGKHPKNSLPIMLGVILMAVLLGNDLSTTGMIISVLFSTTLAPIAGSYGPFAGLLAGVLHFALVSNIGIIHGGINLYNNGFSGGLVAGFLVPIIDAFKKGD